jgi:RND family efflux transporter MFP subunit
MQVRALVIPEREAVISSQMAGRITVMKDQIGARFAKDDELASFDCSELSARHQMAEAELESARLTFKVKQDLFALHSAGESEVALAQAALAKAQAQVALARAQKEACSIRAPFDGIVTRTAARAFQNVTQGQQLLEIVSRQPTRVRMNVPSTWLAWLREGTTFRLKLDETARQYRGRITMINGRVDPVSQTVEIEGDIEDSHSLTAGMSGYATFPKGRK